MSEKVKINWDDAKAISDTYYKVKATFDEIEAKYLSIKSSLEDVYEYEQVRQILYGLRIGVEMSLLANPKLHWKHMFLICRGYEQGLTKEQLEIVADSKFTDEQANQILIGFRNGLTVKQVLSFADHRHCWEQMKDDREVIEDGLMQI